MSMEELQTRIEQLEQALQLSQAHEKTLSNLLEKKLNEIYIHYHISRTIASVLDLQEMLGEVVAIMKKYVTFDRVSIYAMDGDRKHLELLYSDGLDMQQKTTLQLGEGTPGRIAQHGEHIHIHDLSVFYETFQDFLHHPGENKRGGSYIGIALKVHDAILGVFGIDTSVKHGLSVDDMDFMAILSHQLAAGIEKSLLFRKTQILSQHDGLTGLYNHRVFRERLQQEITRRDRTRKSLSLMMLDIDHFKRFNDTYGHQAGDEVLKVLAGIFSRQSRSNSLDTCCRYGGEEFAIIMPEIGIENTVIVAERIRNAVEEYHFMFKGGKDVSRVTVSIGIASLTDEDDQNIDALIKRADDALYHSKNQGRNQVSCAPVKNN